MLLELLDQLNNPGIIFLSIIVVFMYIFKLQLDSMPDVDKKAISTDKYLEIRKKLSKC
ncbi:hypothetical protein [Sulfurimonas sp.]|uniref:hypothetical protein n=1 Tax=Sulfurimonas sp. TaxID=2022749 RepID=UPI00356B2B88